jgi:hypothetical protein
MLGGDCIHIKFFFIVLNVAFTAVGRIRAQPENIVWL